jgi:putative Mg2+ transporter-C (MgtC) family protein
VVPGVIIGIEHESRDQRAGVRTQSLLSVGAALLGLISVYRFLGCGVASDRSRVAAQLVTGIRFLGVGAIIRLGVTIRGLTTAA